MYLKKLKRNPILITFFFALLAMLLFIHCSFEKPSAPSWDVDVTIPLMSKVYTMTEIAEDETSLSVDSTGLLNFEIEEELDHYYVGDELKIDAMQESFGSEIGNFSVDSPGMESVSAELREIYPFAETFHGQTTVVPPFSFATDRKPMEPYDDFSYVLIDTGHVLLKVTNNLAVPLGSPLSLEIWDSNADTLILANNSSVQVLPGTTRSFLIRLDGKKMSNRLSIRMSGESPGSEGQPVFIDANSQFGIDSEISDLLVKEALARIPSKTSTTEEAISITDSIVVSEAKLASGSVQLRLGGNFPLDAWLVYELPDFVSEANVALTDSVFLSRNTSKNVSIDLTNYLLKPQLEDFTEQKVRFKTRFTTIGTGNEFVLVKNVDNISAQVSLSELRFSRISGKLGAQEINLSEDEFGIDIPVDMDSIFFETASMEIIVENGINFPATTNLKIEGQNDAGLTSELQVNADISPASTPGTVETSVIELNKQNSNINEFISILPSLIRVFGQIRIADESWVGTVSPHDFVSGRVRITAPLALQLPPQRVETDVEAVEISEDTRNDIEDNLSDGQFFAELRSHLPLGASVEFVFAQDTTKVFDQPILAIGPVEVAAGEVGADGFVSTDHVSKIDLSLSEEQMRTFLKSPLYMGMRIGVDGSEGEVVRVRGSDSIEVKSYGKIKIKVNQD